MKTNHTPGPWRVRVDSKLHGECTIFTGKNGPEDPDAIVAEIAGGLGAYSGGCTESKANAHLISAAPDMYAVLLDLAQLAADEFADDSEIDGADFLDWFSECRPAILAAVAKAQGG